MPAGTDTVGVVFGSSFFAGGSSSTRPSCTFVFFPLRSSASDLNKLVLPCSLLARSPMNPEPRVLLGPVSCGPLPLARNCVALMFSIPGFLQVTMVVVSPLEKEAMVAEEALAGEGSFLKLLTAGEEEGSFLKVLAAGEGEGSFLKLLVGLMAVAGALGLFAGAAGWEDGFVTTTGLLTTTWAGFTTGCCLVTTAGWTGFTTGSTGFATTAG